MKLNLFWSKTHHALTNPYVKEALGRQEWNDRYLNMRTEIKRWQGAFFSLSIIVIALTLALVYIALSAKVTPFIVETHHGIPYDIKALTSVSAHDARIINYAVNQFIINARTRLSDATAQQTLINKVYAYSANDTLTFLHDYYRQHHPLARSGSTVAVAIINALPLSPATWQITWEEREHDAGAKPQTTRWMAHVTVKWGDVNREFINDNPFGLYVTHLSWSQSKA